MDDDKGGSSQGTGAICGWERDRAGEASWGERMRQGNDQKDPKNGTEDKVDRGRGRRPGAGDGSTGGEGRTKNILY